MRRRFRTPARNAIMVLGAVTIFSGCGGGKSTVTGKVTYNGKPVVWGTVILIDAQGQYHQGAIDLGGNYTTDDAVPEGAVKIGVVSPKPEGGKVLAPKGGAKAGGGSGFEDPRDKFMKEQGTGQNTAPPRTIPPTGAWFPIPSKYADPNTSGLSGTVKKGDELKIELTG
jgi:hypothetical protein